MMCWRTKRTAGRPKSTEKHCDSTACPIRKMYSVDVQNVILLKCKTNLNNLTYRDSWVCWFWKQAETGGKKPFHNRSYIKALVYCVHPLSNPPGSSLIHRVTQFTLITFLHKCLGGCIKAKPLGTYAPLGVSVRPTVFKTINKQPGEPQGSDCHGKECCANCESATLPGEACLSLFFFLLHATSFCICATSLAHLRVTRHGRRRQTWTNSKQVC